MKNERQDKKMSRDEARKFYEETDLSELDLKPVEVEVKKPLGTILSVRMNTDYMKKLSALAKAQKLGITTMARRLLEDALDHPGHQMLFPTANSVIVAMNKATLPGVVHARQYVVLDGHAIAAFEKTLAEHGRAMVANLFQLYGTCIKEGDPSFDALNLEVS